MDVAGMASPRTPGEKTWPGTVASVGKTVWARVVEAAVERMRVARARGKCGFNDWGRIGIVLGIWWSHCTRTGGDSKIIELRQNVFRNRVFWGLLGCYRGGGRP